MFNVMAKGHHMDIISTWPPFWRLSLCACMMLVWNMIFTCWFNDGTYFDVQMMSKGHHIGHQVWDIMGSIWWISCDVMSIFGLLNGFWKNLSKISWSKLDILVRNMDYWRIFGLNLDYWCYFDVNWNTLVDLLPIHWRGSSHFLVSFWKVVICCFSSVRSNISYIWHYLAKGQI